MKNADGGTITFPIITYKESGTHYYQITEVKDEKPAYQYDESKYVVKVDVTDDNAGKLTAKVTSVTNERRTCKELKTSLEQLPSRIPTALPLTLN